MRVLKSQASKQLRLSELSSVFEKCTNKHFRIFDYGVSLATMKKNVFLRACSTVQAGEVLGIQPTVFVLEPPKLVCRAVLGSYQRCLKDF